jgi:RNA ligase
MTIEFQAFPKLQRLNGPVIVTEKIDGTNACIIIENGEIAAQSRTRIIVPGKDNFGFATWVHTNKDKLITLLGEGRHYGEWWGAGIQRGYNKKEKCFSLFNTSRWSELDFSDNYFGVWVVPVLFVGTFVEVITELPDIMRRLKENGSAASYGYMNPEGVVIYDTRSGQGYKKTFDYDDTGKGGQKDEDGNTI